MQPLPSDFEELVAFESIFLVLMHMAWRLQVNQNKEVFMDELFKRTHDSIDKLV